MPEDSLTPQTRHHFTRFDQVNQLASASEADPDLYDGLDPTPAASVLAYTDSCTNASKRR